MVGTTIAFAMGCFRSDTDEIINNEDMEVITRSGERYLAPITYIDGQDLDDLETQVITEIHSFFERVKLEKQQWSCT